MRMFFSDSYTIRPMLQYHCSYPGDLYMCSYTSTNTALPCLHHMQSFITYKKRIFLRLAQAYSYRLN